LGRERKRKERIYLIPSLPLLFLSSTLFCNDKSPASFLNHRNQIAPVTTVRFYQ